MSGAPVRERLRDALARPLDLAVELGVLRASRAHHDALLVLTFHRVMPASRRDVYAYPGLAVTPEALDAILAALVTDYDIGPLSAQHARFRRGEASAKPRLAITFDDGQLDDLVHAAPVLARHGVHATFYLPVDAIASAVPLFHDRLGFVFGALDGAVRDATLARFGLEDARDAGSLMEALKPKPVEMREAVLAALVEASGRTLDALVPDQARPLTWDEARRLVALGHEVGSHACSHRPLPELDDRALRDECARSRATIARELGTDVRSICYPNGDADARVAKAARDAGYENGVTTRWGTNERDADAYLLARSDIDARRIGTGGSISKGLLALRLSGLRRDLGARARSASCTPHQAGPKVAYFVSEYPSRSHTFIRREIDALRRRGGVIVPFSIRRQGEDTLLDARDRASHAETTPVLPARPATFARAHATALFRAPSRYVRTLRDATTHRLPGGKNLVWSVFHFAEGIALADALEKEGTSHLHVHFANAGANVGRLAARHLGIPYSMTLHGTSDFEYPAGPLLEAKLRESAFAACVSRFGRAQAMRLLPPDQWHKLVVVRCGVELDQMPRAARVARTDGRIEVVCVGRLSSEKGHLGLIEAFAIASRHDPRLVLTLVGDGPLRSEIEASIAEHGLTDAVRLVGALAEGDALAAIAAADLFALPSFMEGIPLVLMEAMALGVPVVAPRVSGIPELVEHGVTGLLYTASAWDELAEGIERLATDPALRDTLAVAARAKVEAEFAIDAAVAPLERALFGR